MFFGAAVDLPTCIPLTSTEVLMVPFQQNCELLGGHRFMFAMSRHRFFSQLVVIRCRSGKLTNLTYLTLDGNMAGTVPTEM
jgi:hypothetical protein